MNCPKCKQPSGVINSRPTSAGFIYRRRRCPECKHRFSTKEVVTGKTSDAVVGDEEGFAIMLPKALRGRLVRHGVRGIQIELFVPAPEEPVSEDDEEPT